MDAPLVIAVASALGVLAGAAAPLLVASCPEPAVDPSENPDDFPDRVPFVAIARRRGVRTGCLVAGALAGSTLAVALTGDDAGSGSLWGLAWLIALIAPCLALAVIDLVTWFLPRRLVAIGAVAVLLLEVAAAVALDSVAIVATAAVGALALGAYYGVVWFVMPRAMAFGDVRLAALLGLALGPFGAAVLLLSVVLAAVLSVLALVPLRRGGSMIRRRVPYGPFLVAGAWLAVLGGQVLAAS